MLTDVDNGFIMLEHVMIKTLDWRYKTKTSVAELSLLYVNEMIPNSVGTIMIGNEVINHTCTKYSLCGECQIGTTAHCDTLQ